MKRERIPKGLMDQLRMKLRGITKQAVYQRIHRIQAAYKPPISLVDGAGVLAALKTDIDLHEYYPVEHVDRIRRLVAELKAAPAVSSGPILIPQSAPKKAEPPRQGVPAPALTDREITEYLKREFRYTRTKVAKRLKKICAGDQQLKDILLRDICDAVRCYAHELWKPAVILCGGAIEGILSQPIAREPAVARDAAYLRAYPTQKRAKKMSHYRLMHYLDVAAELEVIKGTTAKLGQGIRDYRNYIHPLAESEEKHQITDGDARIACELVFKLLEGVGK